MYITTETMNLENLQAICNQLPGTTTDIKWEDHLCFNVGEKMYLVTAPDAVPVSASFKVSDEDFASMCELPGIIPAPYMARNKWVRIDDISRLSKTEWEVLLKQSYTLIASKLTVKLRRELGIN